MRPRRDSSLDLPALVRRHQGVIRAFLARLCGDTALADDLAQDSFLSAFKNIDQLQNPKAAKAWLFQIAYHSYVSHVRKQSRRKALASNDAEEDTPQTAQVSPSLRVDIHAAMAALPPEQRAVIMMCLSYGMSHSEAASASGLPLGTVKSHISRGRTALRASLNAYESL